VNDLYKENYKPLKKTREDGKISHAMEWWNQRSENCYTTKSNLHVQHNSHQNPNDIHHRDLKINPKVYLEAQKTVTSQGNTEQKEQYWRCNNI
jgi:hypothetical protein